MGHGQLRVIIYITSVELEYILLHAKFHDHRTISSVGEDFYNKKAWQPSWSCDLYHLYKLSFPLPKEAPHEIWLRLAKQFQRRRRLIMVIYMYIARE